MSKISILQVGRDNWSNTYELPDNVRFFSTFVQGFLVIFSNV